MGIEMFILIKKLPLPITEICRGIYQTNRNYYYDSTLENTIKSKLIIRYLLESKP